MARGADFQKGGEKKMLALIPFVGPLLSIAALVGGVILLPVVAFDPAALATIAFAF